MRIIVQTEPIFFLFLHTITASNTHVKLVTSASHAHLGGPPIYQSTDPELFNEFNVDPSLGPVLVAVKDHMPTMATFIIISSETTLSSLEHWLSQHRFPSAFELTSLNFQDVMRSTLTSFVVLTAIERENSHATEMVLKETSKAWAEQSNQPSVLFVWMDLDRWEAWLSNMYGLKKSSHPSVIIADHKRLMYYDVDDADKSISLSTSHILTVLSGISTGLIKAKHSENWVERKIRALHDALEILGEGLANHLALTVFVIVVSLAGIFIVLQRIMAADARDAFQRPLRGKNGARLD